MDIHRRLTPAILAYDGIAYQYMAPNVFENNAFTYVEEHLRILSGYYGVLKPMDGVVPYRLEMQAKVDVDGVCSLYAFWGDSLYREVTGENHTIINMASKEYSKCIEKYLQAKDRFVTFIFGEVENKADREKVVQKGVYCKMARGEMVRYLAGIGAEEPEQAMGFVHLFW